MNFATEDSRGAGGRETRLEITGRAGAYATSRPLL